MTATKKGSKRGRPRTVTSDKLRDSNERAELLRVCDDLAGVLKTRATLDRRLRFQQAEGYSALRLDRAESDLAHFEAALLKALPELRKATKKLQGQLKGFDALLRQIKEYPRLDGETLSDSLFNVNDDCWYNTVVDNLYEPANVWLIASSAIALARYFHTGIAEDFREELLTRVAINLGRSREDLLNKIENSLTGASKEPVKTADRIVAELTDLSVESVRKYRNNKNPT